MLAAQWTQNPQLRLARACRDSLWSHGEAYVLLALGFVYAWNCLGLIFGWCHCGFLLCGMVVIAPAQHRCQPREHTIPGPQA